MLLPVIGTPDAGNSGLFGTFASLRAHDGAFSQCSAKKRANIWHFQAFARCKAAPLWDPGRAQRENLCFSTFFSTVVENFGGRPYGLRARDADCNTGP